MADDGLWLQVGKKTMLQGYFDAFPSKIVHRAIGEMNIVTDISLNIHSAIARSHFHSHADSIAQLQLRQQIPTT